MSALSGVTVADDVVTHFQDIKIGKKYAYIQMKLSDDKKVIEMEKTVENGAATYEESSNDFPRKTADMPSSTSPTISADPDSETSWFSSSGAWLYLAF